MEETTAERESRLEVANKVEEANLAFFSCSFLFILFA